MYSYNIFGGAAGNRTLISCLQNKSNPVILQPHYFKWWGALDSNQEPKEVLPGYSRVRYRSANSPCYVVGEVRFELTLYDF